nr:hypothetical protein [Tanacetum cinerariifolium]
MFGQYEYGSQHTVGGSSSQPNVGGSSSLIRHFILDDIEQMYSSQFLKSYLEEESLVEKVKEIQVPAPKKKKNRRRQPAPVMKMNRKAMEPRCVPWTTEREIALYRSLVRISEDTVVGNTRKTKGFWVEIVNYMHSTYPVTKRQTEQTKYHVEYGVLFTLFIAERYYKCKKLSSVEVREFIAQTKEHKSKRYKLSGDNSFNMRESKDGSFNLNSTTEDEEDEVHKVRPSHPIGRDQTKKKGKAGTSSASLTTGFDVESLSKLIVNEYEMVNEYAMVTTRTTSKRART